MIKIEMHKEEKINKRNWRFRMGRWFDQRLWSGQEVNVAGCWIENQRSRAHGCMITPRTLTHWNGGTYKPHTPPYSRFYVYFSHFFFILFILSFLFSFFSSCFLLISIHSSLSTPPLSRSLSLLVLLLL